MDVAAETEALLAGLTEEAGTVAEPVEQPPADEQVSAEVDQTPAVATSDGVVEPAIVEIQEQVDDGEHVTTVQATYVATDDAVPTDADTVVEQAVAVDAQPDSSAPIASTEAAAAPESAVADQQNELPVANGVSDEHLNGLPDTTSTAQPTAAADTTQAERGRSKKRRARWGPPANAPAEPAADAAGDGEGRKKRRSRWEEPAPAADDSQQLTVIDTAGGAGFPHEIVLAGGIKVRYLSMSAIMELSLFFQPFGLCSNQCRVDWSSASHHWWTVRPS